MKMGKSVCVGSAGVVGAHVGGRRGGGDGKENGAGDTVTQTT